MATDFSPGSSANQYKIVSKEAPAQACIRILSAVGLSLAHAEFVADTLVQSDVWNHQSHGTLRLPAYVARLKSGAVDPTAEPIVERDSGPASLRTDPVAWKDENSHHPRQACACDGARERRLGEMLTWSETVMRVTYNACVG